MIIPGSQNQGPVHTLENDSPREHEAKGPGDKSDTSHPSALTGLLESELQLPMQPKSALIHVWNAPVQ